MNAKQNVPAASQPNVRWILVWGSVLVVAVLAFVWNLFVIMRDTNRDAGYRELVGNLRVLSQQIEANAREAVDGDAAAFTNLESARADFGRTLDDLANGTDALPSPRPARWLPQRALRVLLLEHAGNLLLEKRAPVGIWAGLWSLPETALDEQKRTARIAEVLAGSGATVRQVALAERQSWLAERISRNLDRMLEGGSGATEAAEQFNADTESFADVLDGML